MGTWLQAAISIAGFWEHSWQCLHMIMAINAVTWSWLTVLYSFIYSDEHLMWFFRFHIKVTQILPLFISTLIKYIMAPWFITSIRFYCTDIEQLMGPSKNSKTNKTYKIRKILYNHMSCIIRWYHTGNKQLYMGHRVSGLVYIELIYSCM